MLIDGWTAGNLAQKTDVPKCFIFSTDNTWENVCEKVQNGEITHIDFRGVSFDKVKHGHWIIGWGCFVCSECEAAVARDIRGISPHYCPNCGAKMDKEDTNG